MVLFLRKLPGALQNNLSNLLKEDMKVEKLIMKSEKADVRQYAAGDVVFSAGKKPLYYYQILEGEVKLYSNNDGVGNKLVHEVRKAGMSIAVFTLFVNESYPFNAVASTDCKIIKLPKAEFFTMLKTYPEISIFLLQDMSTLLHYKFLMSDINLKQNTADKIITLMDHLKRKSLNQDPYSFQITLTRREIGDLTGLRVETVIRAVKKLEKQKLLKITGRKIFY